MVSVGEFIADRIGDGKRQPAELGVPNQVSVAYKRGGPWNANANTLGCLARFVFGINGRRTKAKLPDPKHAGIRQSAD